MQRAKLSKLIRTITTSTAAKQQSLPSTAFTLSSLTSYYEPNTQDLVYNKNRAINWLIKSGNFNHAHNLFDEMSTRDVVTYNMMISVYNKFGMPKNALLLYDEMVLNGIKESETTFSSVLSICSNKGFGGLGFQVHCRVLKLGFGDNLFIGSSVVGLYMELGEIELGLRLFDELDVRNLATWNVVLRGICELSDWVDVLLGLECRMKSEGVVGNGLTFCYLIRGCCFCDEMLFNEGRRLHCHVIKVGWADVNIFVANALVDFYSATESLADAVKAFKVIAFVDVISWNSIVSVYAHYGFVVDALELLNVMQLLGKRPSVRSCLALVNLCSRLGNDVLGKQVHCSILKLGFKNESVYMHSALIDMYGKCRNIENSVLVFEDLPVITLECCNSLMTSLLYCGMLGDVFEMFGLMVDEGIRPDYITFSTTLKALSVSASTSLTSCKLVHCCALKSGYESDMAVSCALVDAYSRSGHIKLSKQIFDQLPSPDVIFFTSMMNGFALNGFGRECLGTFKLMIEKGLKPDRVTFLCVLTACSHSGLVEEGRWIFDSMRTVYGISPDREHFSCMVDLLGRAGLLSEAEELLQQASERGDCVMWSSLLRSCKIHRNEVVGKRAAEVLLDLHPKDFAGYLQVSNFYSEIGEFEEAMHIREIAVARKMTREIGHSLIEVNGQL